jgi:O-antigen/teichoic acid export membrane protein
VKRRLIKNAFSNLMRGSAGAVVALLLPPVLVRHMSAESYAVWVLILQVAAYVGYLDLGLQTAVGRSVAFANEKKDPKLRDGIFGTAFAGLSIAALIGVLLTIAAAAASRRIFPNVPQTLLSPMRICLLIVGASVALGLPASSWSGVFVGMQRYEIPAITNVAAKLLSAIGLIWTALTGRSLICMAIMVAGANVVSYGLQFLAFQRIAHDVRLQSSLITRSTIREVSEYSISLSLWSFSMLLINGFDLLLVGRFEFGAVIPYSVAAALIVFLGGVQNGIFGVIMPHAATLHARQSAEALGNLLVRATKLGVLLLLLTGLPLIAFASPLIKIWIGAQFAHAGSRILIVLVIANIIRLTGVPFASILVGTGQQKLVVLTPLMEGITNLVFSVVLGLKYGAIGVAWGTLIGAVAAVAANVCYNMPRVIDSIRCSPTRYFFEAMAEPGLCGVPFWLALAAKVLFKSIGMRTIVGAWLVSFCACGLFILKANVPGFRFGAFAGRVDEKE